MQKALIIIGILILILGLFWPLAKEIPHWQIAG
jgi:hypothetical protein